MDILLTLLSIFTNNILPILAIAAIGYFFGERLGLDPKTLGRLIFNIFSPALVFHSLATTQVPFGEVLYLFGAVTVYILALALLAALIAAWLFPDRVTRAGVILCAVVSNSGNYGLPVIRLAFGAAVFERALLIFVLLTIFTYTLGVFVASSGNRSAREALVGILKVPAFYLSIIGLALNWLQIQLPAPVNSALVLLKDGTFPVMLILLGIQLRHVRINEGWRAITVSTVGRLLVAPGLAVVIGLVLGLTQVSFVAFVLQASMPVAVIATVMAGEFNLDDKQISSTVLLTTLISPFTLSLLIFYFQTAYL